MKRLRLFLLLILSAGVLRAGAAAELSIRLFSGRRGEDEFEQGRGRLVARDGGLSAAGNPAFPDDPHEAKLAREL